MLKRLIFALLFLVVILAVYLFWPLTTDDFKIIRDNAARIEKQDFLSAIERPAKTDSLPNVLLIVADDLGVNDISLYGNGKVNTPVIDGIAQSGISFDDAYCASPVCSPSRAAILTGRYPQRFGFEFQMHDRYLSNRLEYYAFKFFVKSGPWTLRPMEKVPRQKDIDRQGLPPSEITIPEMLKARGYATALIGKWHLGWDKENLPCRFGFDYQYGFYESNSLYAPEGTKGITDQRNPKDFTDKVIWEAGRKGAHAIFRNCEKIEEKEHLTDAITRECISFIRQERQGPFFIMAAYNAPHTPLQAPDRYVEMFNDEPDPVKRVYYAMIRQLDDDIGRLIEELRRDGLLENTLVIFISDNGGAEYTTATDNGPLRGGKITDFEGGLRVPLFISWPGRITPGSHYGPPVIEMDVFSTIAAATGCPLPGTRKIDGKDLMTFIGNDSIGPHPQLYWKRGHSKAIRSDGWKAIWNDEFGDTLLYNIREDPDEDHDLFLNNKDKALQLTKRYSSWSDSLVMPLWLPVVYFREKVDDRWFYFDN